MILDINDRLALVLIKLAKRITSNSIVYKKLKESECDQKWYIEDLHR